MLKITSKHTNIVYSPLNTNITTKSDYNCQGLRHTTFTELIQL